MTRCSENANQNFLWEKTFAREKFCWKIFCSGGSDSTSLCCSPLGDDWRWFFCSFFTLFFLPTMTVSPFNTWSSNWFLKRCEQLVFTPHRSWSRWKCRRHCKYSDYRLYILYILGHKWLKGWKKNHTSRNISKFPLFYDFCLEPDWRLSDRVLLENKKKWGNFLVGVLALNQQQLNRNRTKTWKSTARCLIGPNKSPVNFSAKEVNCLMISKYLSTSSLFNFILAGKLYCF